MTSMPGCSATELHLGGDGMTAAAGLDFNDLLLDRAPEHVEAGMTCETENVVAAAIQDGQAAA